jgi:hypothetical protein
MGRRRLRLGVVLILIVLILTAAVLYIRPSRTLDMSYTDIVWKDKIQQIVKTGQPEITFTEADLNNLAKKGLAEALAKKDIPVSIVGAELHLNGNLLSIDFNAEWGFLIAGGTVEYEVEYDTGQLYLTPVSLHVKQLPLPAEKLGLEPIVVDLSTYLPEVIQITKVNFEGHDVKVRISVDLMEILNYLQTL